MWIAAKFSNPLRVASDILNIIFLAASIYFLEAENLLGPFIIGKLSLVEFCPEGILAIFSPGIYLEVSHWL